LLANSTAHTVVPWIYPKLPYDAQRDFAAVATLASLPNVLVVPASKGYRSVNDVLQAARARPNALNYASAGSGTSTHLAAEKFRLATGIAAVHVPYKGTPEALAATVAGDVDFFFAPASSVLPHIKSGALVALSVSASSQAPGLPNVRTLSDAGVPGADAEFWIGLFAPKGTPASVINRLNREVHAILAMPDVVEKLAALGATPRPMSASSFDAMVRSDLQAHRELVRATGLKPD
jgi:tripartite-type tricarboxylate transporter receptor subunit TctC